MLTLPNFERLKIFHLVYLNSSIQKAADALHVTRSAVSQSLKRLEQELGFKLFIRDSKKFEPTSEARDLFESIDPLLVELMSTLERLDTGLKTPSGVIRIGAPMDLGSNQLTQTIARFKKIYPKIDFEMHLAVPVKQLEMLTSGKLDLAFIDNGDIHASQYAVTTQPYMKEEFVLVASKILYKSHELTTPDYTSLSTLPFIDYLPHGPVTRMWFKHHYSKIPADLKISFSAESVQAVLNAVHGGLGAGVVPTRLLTEKFQDLKVIETPRGRFINEVVIARRLGSRPNFREKEFIHFCKNDLK